MLGKVFAVLVGAGILYSALCGDVSAVTTGAFQGAARAVEVTISLMGVLCLWNGILAVFRAAGLMRRLAKLLSPILRRLFPTAYTEGAGESISAALSANMLGLGNAATPLALSAMEAMQKNNPDKTRATDDMVMFTVLGTASVNLFPGTLIALRVAAGSADPFCVLPFIWLGSVCGTIVAILTVKGLRKIGRKRRDVCLGKSQIGYSP